MDVEDLEVNQMKPENGDNEIVCEYSEMKDQIEQIHDITYQSITGNNNEDIQILQIGKQEAIDYHILINNGQSKSKLRCLNKICRRNNLIFDTKIELDDHDEMHVKQFRNFICPICNRFLGNHTKLVDHMESRHNPKQYTCDQCGKIFKRKDNMRMHMSYHRKYFNVECKACNRSYKTIQSLRYHLRQHFEKYQCETCGQVFEYKKVLLGHIAVKHYQELLVQCRFCTRKFARIDTRDDHEKNIHKDGMIRSPYPCNKCDAAFNLQDELKHHEILNHFRGTIHTCEECGKNFKKKTTLDLHTSVHRKKEIQCDICKKMFTFITGLNKHKKMQRCKGPPAGTLAGSKTQEEMAKIAKQQLMEITVNPKYASNFTCDDEDIMSMNKDTTTKKKPRRKREVIKNIPLKKEKEQKHPVIVRNMTEEEVQEQLDDINQEIVKSSSGRIIKRKLPRTFFHQPLKKFKKISIKLTCDYCGVEFDSRAALKSHFNNHVRINESLDASSNSSINEIKGRKQSKNNSLNSKKKFVCDICDKSYISKYLLDIHMNSHKNLKEFKCNHENCSFETNSPYNLKNHINRVHDSTRPFKCDESGCDKKFKRRCDMINHKKSIHTNVKIYAKCPLCEAVILEKGLQSHMINSHTEKARERPYECTVCGKRERYEKMLQKHYYNVHEPKYRGAIYNCPDCSQSFYRQRNLKAHSFDHYEGEVFQCLVCSNKYKTKKELNHHENYHNQKSFPCPHCDLVFQTKSGRIKHLKKHTDPVDALVKNKDSGDQEIEDVEREMQS